MDYRATTDAADRRQPDQPRVLQPRRRGLRQRSRTTSCTLNASRYTPVDATLIPTGALDPVAGTPMDFTRSTAIGARIRDGFEQLVIGRGYDHNWVLDRRDNSYTKLELAARVDRPRQRPGADDRDRPSPGSSSTPATSSTARSSAPAAGCTARATGSPWRPSTTRTRRTTPNFPSTVLRPGQTYQTTTIYQFGTTH